MLSVQIAGHSQVLEFVKTRFLKTIDFIELNMLDSDQTQTITDMITRDLTQTLIQILEVLPRAKALSALDLYHEHDQFRQKLSGFKVTEFHVEPSESDFNPAIFEEEKLTLEQTPPVQSKVEAGPFKEAFEDVIEEVVHLYDHVTSKYTAFKNFVK